VEPGEVKYFPVPRPIVGYLLQSGSGASTRRARTIPRVLDDGSYDAIVVDAEEADGSAGVRLELAIASGPRKGEVVSVTGSDPAWSSRDPLELLAIPATIVVVDGTPTVTLEP
jgi:hypothetical protein